MTLKPDIPCADVANSRRQIVIGGIPEPIGGVTTYLRRLLHRDRDQIEALLDFYPGAKEPVRETCQSKVVQLGDKAELLRWLWTHKSAQVGREVFFNFSTPRALMLTLFARRVTQARWSLMLHHGNLMSENRMLCWAVRVALARFDEIKSLSASQTAFYRAMHVPEEKIVAGSSYCEPADHVDDAEALETLARIRDSHAKVLVMSGFPKPLYNFELGIDAVAALGDENVALCLFIYGPGELRERLRAHAETYPWLFVFDGRTERYFNTFLRQCDLLMRLTETDSFGISVRDADHWGRKILASDVCERPDTAKIFELKTASKDHLGQLIESLGEV